LRHPLLALGNDPEVVSGKLHSLKNRLGCGKKSLDAPSKPVNLKPVRGIKADSPNDNYRDMVSKAIHKLVRKPGRGKIISVTSCPLVVIQQ
jgi:hypothetical protein